MQFEIKNRFTGEVQFVAEIEEREGDSFSFRVGLAVKWAIKTGADLTGAYLRGAYLGGADLMGADLMGAYLTDADLRDADLTGADLRGADLRGADLRGADLAGAYLTGAYLRGADLTGAYLMGADGEKNTIEKIPIQILSADYPIIIFDEHMKIGCEFHSLADWWKFDTKRIAEMDGTRAAHFWKTWKKPLQSLCKANGRS